jgi:hypothetical protein
MTPKVGYEDKSQVKSEIKHEVKPEIKPEIKPKIKNEIEHAIILKPTPIVNDSIKKFQQDKKSFLLMKKDIENKKLTFDNMDPAFLEKYLVFDILYDRNIISVEDKNLDDEYEEFSKMFDILRKANNKETEHKERPHIPHNYSYMSYTQKVRYARKYKMSVKEFEEKFINEKKDEEIKESNKESNEETKESNEEIISLEIVEENKEEVEEVNEVNEDEDDDEDEDEDEDDNQNKSNQDEEGLKLMANFRSNKW